MDSRSGQICDSKLAVSEAPIRTSRSPDYRTDVVDMGRVEDAMTFVRGIVNLESS